MEMGGLQHHRQKQKQKHKQTQQHKQQASVGSLSNTCSSSDLNRSSSSNSISASASASASNNYSDHHHQQRRLTEMGEDHGGGGADPMQSWWESVSKARARVQALVSLLSTNASTSASAAGLWSLADSDRPGRSLLDSPDAYSAVSSALSGSGDDPLCQWLYDTFLSEEGEGEAGSDLRLVVLSLVPLVAGLYMTRVHAYSTTEAETPSLAGFEAVLLALYSSEVRSRAGKPLVVSVPSPAYLSQHPSLYHHPGPEPRASASASASISMNVGVVSPPLEAQVGIKSTKRATIVGVAFHSYYTHISQMPPWSKLDLCRFSASWAGPDCPCSLSLHPFEPRRPPLDLDDDGACVDSYANGHHHGPSAESNGAAAAGEIIISRLNIREDNDDADVDNHQAQAQAQAQQQQPPRPPGKKIPLPWELLQPLLRVLAHCLLAPLNPIHIKDAAAVAVARLHARASHEISPKAILATRSLVQLHSRSVAAAQAKAAAAALPSASSNTTPAATPRPPHKPPQVLLVSK